jgi:hypothetical protein
MTDMSEHRVTMLGASWRRNEDPTLSRDPQVRAVVASLAALPTPAPRPEFRADLRAQLVAIAPRIVAEGLEAETPMIDIVPRTVVARPAPARRPRPGPTPTPTPAGETARPAAAPRHADGFLDRLRGVHLGRGLGIAASLVVVFALLLGGAVWMSKKALPGDSLYSLKRASERFELATASSDREKAQDYLDFAATRADEVRDLLGHASTGAAGTGVHASGIDSGTVKLVQSTLNSADTDVRSASTILGKQAVRGRTTGPLNTMTAWAPAQLHRLQSLAAEIPAGTARSRITASANLVTQAVARARALAPRLGCSCLASSGSDSLGPIPCDVCTQPASTTSPNQGTPPAGKRTKTGHGHTAPGENASGDGAGSRSAKGSTRNGGPSTTPNAPPPSTTPVPGKSTPILNLPTPSLPVNVKSCGLGVSLGPIGLNLGLCPLSVGLSLHP